MIITIQGKTYITIAEASKLVQMSCGHIQKLASESKVIATKIGRAWAVSKESIISYQQEEKKQKRPSKENQISNLKMHQTAFKLGHKMRKSPDGRVYCTICQETISNIQKEKISCKKQ